MHDSLPQCSGTEKKNRVEKCYLIKKYFTAPLHYEEGSESYKINKA